MPVDKQSTCVLLILVILAGILVPVGIIADADDYRYYSMITIDNSGGSSDETAPFIFIINADALTDAGWVQDDFEDVKILSGSTEQYLTVTNTGSTSAEWRMAHATVSAGSLINRHLWMGNSSATRNQVWISRTTDTLTASDDSSLDITTELTVAGAFYLTATPTGTATASLVSKNGAYQLYATSGTIVFSVDLATPHVVYLQPNGVGDETNIDDAYDGGLGAVHWSSVDDNPPLKTAAQSTYVIDQTSGDGYTYDLYQLTDLTAAEQSHLDNITSISFCYRAKDANPPDTAYQRPRIKLGGVTLNGTEDEMNSVMTSYTRTASRPGGGSWQKSDLNSLQAGIGINVVTGGNTSRCCQIYLAVSFSTLYVEAPITSESWMDIRGTYDGTTARLYIDEILQDSMALTNTIRTTASPVVFAAFDGYCDDIYIADTDTETPNKVAEYTFEPLDIDGTTIDDLTSGTNNAITYTWAANPASVDITMNKITPYLLSYYSGEGVSSEDPDGIQLDFPDEPDNAFDDADFDVIPGSGFINDQLDGAEIPRALFWYTLILLIAIGVGFLAFDLIRDILATTLATAGALIIGAVTDMGIGYVDILAVAIVMIALYIRREHSTGRL